jgi:hypothetical protein
VAELSDKQAWSIVQAVATGAPVSIWDGSVRSGKTLSSEIAWLEHVRAGPRGALIMVGRSLDTLERNVIQPMMDMLPQGSIRHTRLSTTARIFGRLVWLTGANDNTAENKIRGLTLAGAYVDEASLLPENFWPMLRTRLSIEGAKMLATTNPDNPQHWLKKTVIDLADQLGFNRFAFRLPDNPALPPSYVAQIKAELHGLFYRRYIDGDWVAAEGAVYDMLDLEHRHRVRWQDVPSLERFVLGIDVGTTNPTHAVLLGVGTDQRFYVCGEWRYDAREKMRQLTDAEQDQRLVDWLLSGAEVPPMLVISEAEAARQARQRQRRGQGIPPQPVHPERIGIDPTAASFRRQLASTGWTGIARPNTESVVDGIRMVQSLIGAGRMLFVEDAAPELEGELMGYVWDEDKAGKGEDAPVKLDDHGPDALRYAVTASRYLWRGWTVAVA